MFNKDALMMKKTFYQFINFILIAQLILPQYVWANSTGPRTSAPAASSGSQTPERPRTGADTFADIMQGTTQIANNILNTMRQQYSQAEAQNQLRQLTGLMNPHVCPVNGQPAPCVSEIFPECNILNTRPNFTEPSVCMNGIDPNDPTSNAKAGQALGFFEHYTQMENSYKNFMLSSNNTSNLGIGCLNSRAEELGRKLQQREKEIDNLINKMQKTQDDFKKKAERDRAKIEDAQALLNGGGAAAGVLARNSVRFDNAFNDPACRSMIDGETFNNTGKSAGLKGILDSVAKSVNKKPQGNGFSAAEFTPSTAQAVEKQLDQITKFLAGEVNREGSTAINSDKLTVGSAYGLNQSGALKDIIAQERQKADQKVKDFGTKIEGFAPGPEYANLKGAALDPNKNIDQQIKNFERTTKNKCLENQSNIASLIGEKLSIINPSGSDAANRSADNAYAKFVRDTLRRSDITIEDKMNLISAQEGKDGNSLYRVDTQTSATMDGTSLKVTSKLTPANFVKLHIDNCKAQFDNNVNDAGVTNRQIAENFKKVSNEVKSFRSTLASNLVNQINDRVKNCSDSYQANATGVAVCSENSFSTASSDFCLKRANSCATNMRQCLDKANKQVQQVTEKRDQAVAQYSANVEKNEADLRKIYEQVEALTAIDGINISAKLKQSLTLPTENLKFHINKEERKFVKGLLDGLEVVNPDEYFNLMKTNLLSLKDEIKKQNVAVMKGTQDGNLTPGSAAQSGVLGHIANINENMKKAIDEIAEYKNKCMGAFQAYMQGQRQASAQAAQQRAEQDKERGEYCSRMQSIGTVPGCESAEEFDELSSIGARLGDANAARNLRSFSRTCKKFNSDDNNDRLSIFKKNAGTDNPMDYCELNYIENPAEVSRACRNVLKCYFVEDGNGGFVKEGDELKAKETNAVCSDRLQERYDNAVVSEYVSSEARINEETTQLGENRSTVCGSLDNSGSAIGKALMDAAGTAAEAYIQTQSVRTQ
jgi:hypothetical protein